MRWLPLLGHDTDVLLGVLAHELGHVHHRHGTAQLVQVTPARRVVGFGVGRCGQLGDQRAGAAGAGRLLAPAEREADAHAPACWQRRVCHRR